MEIIVNVPPPPTTPDDAVAYKPPTVAIQEDNPDLSEPYDPTLDVVLRVPTLAIAGGSRKYSAGN